MEKVNPELGIPMAVAKHLGLDPGKLPVHLLDDKDKRTPLELPEEKLLAHYQEDSLWTLKTVRFLKDFSFYKAGVHKTTSNKSFLRTAELFRQMGIKNYYFHLQINNPLLENVDPWDPNLTDQQKQWILTECNQNIWYIIREVIKIDGRRFIGNRAVISFIWSCLNHLPTLILMPRQSGKAMDVNEPIRTVSGWETHGTIRIGDKIITKSGEEANVIGVHPQGMMDAYEIEFQDGRKTVTCSQHQWTVWDPTKQENGRKGAWGTYTTIEMVERKLRLQRSDSTLYVPLPEPDKVTPSKDFPINPYLMAHILLKGRMHKECVLLSKISADQFEEIKKVLPSGYDLKPTGDGTDAILETRNGDWIVQQFESMFRNIRYSDRRIPEEYQMGSYGQRLKFVQGMMDCRGSVSSSKTPYFVNSNKGLVEDFQLMLRSLGMMATLKQKVSKYGRGRVEESISYNLNIRAVDPSVLFKGRSRSKFSGLDKVKSQSANSKMAVKSITPLHERREMVCIEVDHPSELYLTRDYIVTHNTVGMQVMAFIMQYLVGRGYRTGLITLAAPNRMQFINAIKKIRSGLPEFMTEVTYLDKDAGNILTYQAFGEDKKNIFEVRVPNGGSDGADNVARGATWEAMLVDEPAWMKYIENILNGAGPATLTAQRLAREQGIPYFTAQATTPNSVLKEEGKYMYNEMMNSTEFRETFFDSFSETHLVERVLKASPVSTTSPRIVMQFNHLQLGFGKNWVRETMDKLRLSWSKAKIDLLMMWTEEGKDKVFDDKTRERLTDGKMEPIWNEEVGDTGLFIDWFLNEQHLSALVQSEDEFLLYGVDTSDAINKDACTLVIRRLKTGETLGVGRFPLAFLDDVTQVLKILIVRYENSLLIIERNRAAHMIDQLLLMLPALGIDPFKRIFNRVYQDPVKYKNEYKDVQNTHFDFRTKEFYLRHKAHFGFNTTPVTREQMYGYIFEAVNNTGSGIRYHLLIDELIGLETDSNNRIDHGTKGHDDLVIAWLLSYWFIKLGYNKSMYGIPQGCLLTDIKMLMEDPDKPTYGKEQLELFAQIKQRITELSKELRDCMNEMIGSRIEQEIRQLSSFIPKELRKTITVDEIISEAQTERNKRAMTNRYNNMYRRY
jgi:LAGLIDADG-like domain